MVKHQFSFWFQGALALCIAATTLMATPPDYVKIKRAQVRALLETDRGRDPSSGDGYRRLVRMFGEHAEYTAAEVKIAREGLYRPKSGFIQPGKEQNGPPPPGTWPRGTVRDRFAALESLDSSAKGLFARLVERVGEWDWYTTAQVDHAETVPETGEPQGVELLKRAAFQDASIRGEKALIKRQQGPRAPRIRRDWRDVLYDEDPTQTDRKEAVLGDLEGAQISFTHDGVADSDTWAAQAALIAPFTWRKGGDHRFSLRQWAVAPSVTYNRVTTNGDPSVEVDSMFHRVGIYLDYLGLQPRGPRPDDVPFPGGGPNPAARFGGGYGLQVRAAAVYLTDHGLRAGLRGFEADFEPRWVGEKFSLSYRTLLWPKRPTLADESDQAFLDCQLRMWLHTEGGEIQDPGEAWLGYTGSFFRLGPTIQFQLRAPALPGGRALSLTTLYSYLAAVSGPSDHPTYFRGTLAYDLFHDAELNHKVSINASYENGGLNLTKQEVDVFTISLGVLF